MACAPHLSITPPQRDVHLVLSAMHYGAQQAPRHITLFDRLRHPKTIHTYEALLISLRHKIENVTDALSAAHDTPSLQRIRQRLSAVLPVLDALEELGVPEHIVPVTHLRSEVQRCYQAAATFAR